MRRVILSLLLIEAVTFMVAAAVHAGILISGYEHREARIAETAIAAVLVCGWAAARLRPSWTRAAGVIAQGFALFWTLVGVATIAAGIGPQSIPDIAYHIGIVVVLVWGLVVAQRARVGSRQ
jgi:hypothetical protein